MVTEMAPKNVRNAADKPDSARQARMAKEGSDGHPAGKRFTGGSIKIGCKKRDSAGEDKNHNGEDADKDWAFETRKAENDGRNIDWSKDGGDKSYSLTEESEAASSGYDLNEEDGSGSSEAESLSPAVGHTVMPQRQHRKRIMSRTAQLALQIIPRGVWRRSSGTTQELDCRNPIKILRPPQDTVLNPNLIADENCPGEQINNMASTDTKMLQLIYGTVRELQTETRVES
ncbi:hypothetical protein NDU88_002301 [Pleurodeles waltl]|uniref:Uncharacterized protein n=1 Tax=Pleurodeles waltl TaxID=8319 RepID=A0AAV7Q9H3_PLEWA|nr:hypothetical protein NDU88_002301 [Pleurodeles waltl]